MDLAMIGLGKMGGNMTTRLLKGGHRVVAYARSAESVHAARGRGAPMARTAWTRSWPGSSRRASSG